jgi:dCTP deaminase
MGAPTTRAKFEIEEKHMSVIPLTIDGNNPTVVRAQERFRLDGNAVLIQELDEAQLMAAKVSNTSYDLRVGSQYRDHRERGIKQIPTGGTVTFHPGAALIIQTEETLHLPSSMYGTIAPKVTLLQRGLSSTFSKVDPGYPGPLLITVFNLGKKTVTLRRGEPFCALTMLEVRPGARVYNKGAKLLEGEPAEQPGVGVWDWVVAHATLVGAGATLLVTLANVIIFVFTLLTRHH